ncbi:RNA polymerase sigma factor [Candidatus Fermentibacteria bacterium]|nr:RNA polymerase sigma factor [Candidatus Fermentibacteria bacterium]
MSEQRGNPILSILQRCIEGDVEAWHRLFVEHSGTITGFLRQSGADPDTADDILIELFCRLMAKNGQRIRDAAFASDHQFRWWLLIIARNLYRDHLRHDRFVIPIGDASPYIRGAPGLAASSEGHMELDPLEAICTEESLNAALGCLSERERYYVRLFYFGGLKYREIAELARVTIGAVSSSIAQAKVKMRSALQQNESLSRCSCEGPGNALE